MENVLEMLITEMTGSELSSVITDGVGFAIFVLLVNFCIVCLISLIVDLIFSKLTFKKTLKKMQKDFDNGFPTEIMIQKYGKTFVYNYDKLLSNADRKGE